MRRCVQFGGHRATACRDRSNPTVGCRCRTGAVGRRQVHGPPSISSSSSLARICSVMRAASCRMRRGFTGSWKIDALRWSGVQGTTVVSDPRERRGTCPPGESCAGHSARFFSCAVKCSGPGDSSNGPRAVDVPLVLAITGAVPMLAMSEEAWSLDNWCVFERTQPDLSAPREGRVVDVERRLVRLAELALLLRQSPIQSARTFR